MCKFENVQMCKCGKREEEEEVKAEEERSRKAEDRKQKKEEKTIRKKRHNICLAFAFHSVNPQILTLC
jgi:hypothetical protein